MSIRCVASSEKCSLEMKSIFARKICEIENSIYKKKTRRDFDFFLLSIMRCATYKLPFNSLLFIYHIYLQQQQPKIK